MIEDFENRVLQEIATMNKTLLAFEGRVETALAEMSGRVKGNKELIIKEFDSYMQKSSCETHREHNGLRVSKIEQRLAVIENQITDHLKDADRRRDDVSRKVTAWLPDLIKYLGIIGAAVYLFTK